MNTRNQLFCAWSGPVCILLFFLGFWPVAQFWPPHPPSLDAQTIAAIYQGNTVSIRFGMLLMLTASAFLLPFSAVIAVYIKRSEGDFPVMAYTQLVAGAIGAMVLIVPIMVFTAVAFRPERAIELTYLLNDMAWLMLIMPFGPAVMQSLSIGLAVLADKSPQPVFPRWVGFFNLWAVLLYLPGGVVTFFKIGPFAWNGLFGIWIPAGVFGVWFFVMFPPLLKAIKTEALNRTSASTS